MADKVVDRTNPDDLPRKGDTNSPKWTAFYDLYAPYISRLAKMRGLNSADAEDIVQKVMKQLRIIMRTFEYDPKKGSFRGFLKTITTRRIIEHERKFNPVADDNNRAHRKPNKDGSAGGTNTVDGLPDDSDTPELQKLEEKEWMDLVIRKALEILHNNPKLNQDYIQLFVAHYIKGESVPKLCLQLNVEPQDIYNAKSRIMPAFEEACKAAKKEVDSPHFPEDTNQ